MRETMSEREEGYQMPTCVGCTEYLTMDEIQGAKHECRISSNDLPEILIALAQAHCFGDAWEVDVNGYGFVVFADPLEARNVRRAIAARDAGAVRVLNVNTPMPDDFREYVMRNYPANTVIGNPTWHAPKLWGAAMCSLRALAAERGREG